MTLKKKHMQHSDKNISEVFGGAKIDVTIKFLVKKNYTLIRKHLLRGCFGFSCSRPSVLWEIHVVDVNYLYVYRPPSFCVLVVE